MKTAGKCPVVPTISVAKARSIYKKSLYPGGRAAWIVSAIRIICDNGNIESATVGEVIALVMVMNNDKRSTVRYWLERYDGVAWRIAGRRVSLLPQRIAKQPDAIQRDLTGN